MDSAPTPRIFGPAFVPQLRQDYVRQDLGGEALVWSPDQPQPFVMDPVATVMLGVIDGGAPISELATEISAEVGVGLDVALAQVTRIIEHFDKAGLLTSSLAVADASAVIARRGLFTNPPSH